MILLGLLADWIYIFGKSSPSKKKIFVKAKFQCSHLLTNSITQVRGLYLKLTKIKEKNCFIYFFSVLICNWGCLSKNKNTFGLRQENTNKKREKRWIALSYLKKTTKLKSNVKWSKSFCRILSSLFCLLGVSIINISRKKKEIRHKIPLSETERWIIFGLVMRF